MKKFFAILLFSLFFITSNAQYSFSDIDIVFDQVVPNANADTLRINFKFTRNGNKIRFGRFDLENITVEEFGFDEKMIELVDVVDIRDKNETSNNQSIIILVDKGKTITEEQLDQEYNALKKFFVEVPNARIYLSAMDGSVTKTKFIRNYQDFDNWNRDDFAVDFHRPRTEKHLYEAIASRIEEIAGITKKSYPGVDWNTQLRDSTNKMLFVLTNGNIFDDKGWPIKDTWDNRFYLEDLYKNNTKVQGIPIYCIYFGGDNIDESDKNVLRNICKRSGGKYDKGLFYESAQIDSLTSILLKSIDNLKYDYQLVLVNKTGKTYNGQPLRIEAKIKGDNNSRAHGEVSYSLGSKAKPITVVKGNYKMRKVLLGFLFGTIFVILAYLIIQYLIPYIQYKLFLRKHVMTYSKYCDKTRGRNEDILQKCYYCKDEFQNDDLVVTKCEHIVHWDCWVENRNRCPEYGGNCKKGIYYYNREKLSDERNAPYFTKWLVFGLIGGMISWLLYQIIPHGFLMPGFVDTLVYSLNPLHDAISPGALLAFRNKLQGMLLCGMIFGFCITFIFSYVIEFRKKNWKNMGFILLKSLINAIIGFVSFLLGSLVIAATGQSTSCFWIDWVPWLIFGCGITWMISFKTEIKFKNALLGGLISVILSFINLFVANFPMVGMFSFMIYSAGLGTAIAVVHFVSEKYFLHIEGEMKPRDVAIYKWMSVTGGFNRVSIGRSIECVIEMNWDDSDNIADKQVEIYLENDRPYCLILADGVIVGSNNWPIKKGEIMALTHGTSFTIGKTKFTYIEKDR